MAEPALSPHIHHVALRVGDCERSATFYAGLLGLRERRRWAAADGVRSIWLEADGVIVMLERRLRLEAQDSGAAPDAGSGHLLAFAATDLASWEARLREAGVPIADRTPHTLYVRDPDGHRVGLSDYRFAD